MLDISLWLRPPIASVAYRPIGLLVLASRQKRKRVLTQTPMLPEELSRLGIEE
jgi:hypothetical protein